MPSTHRHSRGMTNSTAQPLVVNWCTRVGHRHLGVISKDKGNCGTSLDHEALWRRAR